MIIGIEAERANSKYKTGVEHYAKQLILHLAQVDNVNKYILYLRSPAQDWLKKLPSNFSLKIMPFPFFWTQLRVSWEIFSNPVDCLFIPASALPIFHPKNSVITIHDLAWKFYPDYFTNFTRNFLEYSTLFAVKKAKAIIAVSHSTKDDLVKLYGIDEGKVVVVHHGYEEVGVRNQELGIAIPEKYILFLSTLQPRKNLEGLIDSFRDLKIEHPELPHKLVVVGKPGWQFEPILQKIKDNSDIVEYLNYVSDAQRFAIMQNADCLVLPSFYEGFGMQILEAFETGTPLATSNISSMPEVAGEAAVYFDPKDRAQIKNAIKNVLLDKSLAESLRAKGKERLKDFSWEKCARETLEVIKL